MAKRSPEAARQPGIELLPYECPPGFNQFYFRFGQNTPLRFERSKAGATRVLSLGLRPIAQTKVHLRAKGPIRLDLKRQEWRPPCFMSDMKQTQNLPTLPTTHGVL